MTLSNIIHLFHSDLKIWAYLIHRNEDFTTSDKIRKNHSLQVINYEGSFFQKSMRCELRSWGEFFRNQCVKLMHIGRLIREKSIIFVSIIVLLCHSGVFASLCASNGHKTFLHKNNSDIKRLILQRGYFTSHGFRKIRPYCLMGSESKKCITFQYCRPSAHSWRDQSWRDVFIKMIGHLK